MMPTSAASAASTSSGRELPARAAAAVARMRASGSDNIGRARDAASSLLMAPSAAMAFARTVESGSASSRRMFGAHLRARSLRDVASASSARARTFGDS
jgi:hypothetical protein